MRKRLVSSLATVGVVLAAVFVGSTESAQAVTSKDFGPLVVSGIPVNQTPAMQLVVPLATIVSPQLAAGSNAYVYSELNASAADQVNLVDNEIRCTGAGASNVVMGENILPSTGDPAHQNIKLVTRFLVTATSAGTISCTLYLRTSSTSAHVAKETVQGNVRFASYTIPGDVNGAAIQKSLPAGNTVLSSTVVAPVLDRDIPAGYSKVDVVADMEFHWCSTNCTQQFAKARFALSVTTSGGTNCASAPVAQSDEYVARGVNHAAIPLYTTVVVNPGCTHLHAQVTSTYLSGNVGLVGGAATGLTDNTGHTGDLPNHTSVMSHMFALPRTS